MYTRKITTTGHRSKSLDHLDKETYMLYLHGELHTDLANLPRDCLIARKLFFLDSSRREEVLAEANWTRIMEAMI